MKKCIIITESANLLRHFKSSLHQHDFELEKNDLLHNLKVIQKSIQTIGNTSQIRAEFAGFIKKNGFPAMLALDFSIAKNSKGFEKRKLLRTFLISLTVVLSGKDVSAHKNSIVLIGDEDDEELMKKIQKRPVIFFKSIKTDNETINSILAKFSSQEDLVNKYYYFDYLINPKNGVIQGQIHKIYDLITIASRNIAISYGTNSSKAQNSPSLSTQEKELSIIYRISDTEVIHSENMAKESSEEINTLYENYNNGILYVEGDWLAINQMDVSQRILNFVTEKILPRYSNAKDKESFALTINLSDKCRLEKEVLPSILQLIEKELNPLGKITLEISAGNRKKISGAAGFQLIESYLNN